MTPDVYCMRAPAHAGSVYAFPSQLHPRRPTRPGGPGGSRPRRTIEADWRDPCAEVDRRECDDVNALFALGVL
jgi:hypothetical protein